MIQQLEDIKAAWSSAEGGGRDEVLARELCDQLVASNPELFEEIQDKSLPELVEAIDVFHAAGMEEQVWRIEAWLLHRFEPQQIGITPSPVIRGLTVGES